MVKYVKLFLKANQQERERERENTIMNSNIQNQG